MELEIPEFRCEECQRMNNVMDLVEDEEHYLRYSKITELALKLAALGSGYAATSEWVGAVKNSLCHWLR